MAATAFRLTMGLAYHRGCSLIPAHCAGDKVKRLAVDATLRAAAPYQRFRRQRAAEKGKPTTGVFVEKADMRA